MAPWTLSTSTSPLLTVDDSTLDTMKTPFNLGGQANRGSVIFLPITFGTLGFRGHSRESALRDARTQGPLDVTT